MTTAPEIHVNDNAELHRFEITVDGHLAGFAEYAFRPRTIAFVHTEIDDEYAGRGLGSVLARVALDSARHRGLDVLPFCPFIRDWIRRHPAYLDLVPSTRRRSFELDAK
ncbi:GNAT family N-acetyltransferase [Planotetraspora sp. GP83]|uniref:GNAT family N-acetyltransferase n=1 Tax=Planotetraspora sp. GP83 TaxID=3156264 RepID=UPI0035138956